MGPQSSKLPLQKGILKLNRELLDSMVSLRTRLRFGTDSLASGGGPGIIMGPPQGRRRCHSNLWTLEAYFRGTVRPNRGFGFRHLSHQRASQEAASEQGSSVALAGFQGFTNAGVLGSGVLHHLVRLPWSWLNPTPIRSFFCALGKLTVTTQKGDP